MRSPHPSTSSPTTPRIAIIGAGFAGLGAAIQLKRRGIESFVVFEKNDGVGGTWRDNTYPGAACDVPSHLYSFSFAPWPHWPRRYSEQPAILHYLEDCVERFALADHLRLATPVQRVEFDEASVSWRLTTVAGAVHEFDLVVCGLGQLNVPAYPEIPGRDAFEGTAFHSARWDHDHDLAGETVAVIGNGASAVQFVPPVVDAASKVFQFQRSSAWIAPKSDPVYSPRQRSAFARLPLLARAYRGVQWAMMDVRWPMLRRGGRMGDLVEKGLNRYRDVAIADDDLRATLTPDYPVGCKRILLSSDYYPALQRDHVEVVTEAITEITSNAVVTADGVVREVDTIIYGTGFRATEFLAPIDVVGRGGRKLHDEWDTGADAFLGTSVAGYPNLFLLYGPNTNLSHNSIIFMIECQLRQLLGTIDDLVRHGRSALDVRTDVDQAYNRWIQDRMADTVWVADCHSWYKTADGTVTNNWPGPTLRYWAATRRFRPGAYERLAPDSTVA